MEVTATANDFLSLKRIMDDECLDCELNQMKRIKTFDLNMIPQENENIESGESVEEMNVENDFQPFPGQCFLSEEEAFVFTKIMPIDVVLPSEKVVSSQKMEKLKGETFFAIVKERDL
ncbi:hypothetical protein LguiA_002677 [Lonicera macranthoides]